MEKTERTEKNLKIKKKVKKNEENNYKRKIMNLFSFSRKSPRTFSVEISR